VAVGRGDFVTILGTSGSGKSTLLNLFGGLDRPTSGEILFDGQSLAPLSSWEMSRYRLHRVGMIFQSFNLIPTMSARENVSLALAFAGLSKGERRRRSLELLDRVGLLKRADHLPSELSGGEQQRVSIARAIANEPQVLLADEPTGNLDSSRAAEVLGVLDEMRRRDGKTIVLVTHDRELADRFATLVVRLKDGKVIAG
jgi:putative ABC transport system ATP-binding protein